jgi:hypothetical protein
VIAASLTALAEWIEDNLGDELASRQAVAEHALAEVRALAGRVTSIADAAADQRVTAAREYLAAVRPHKVHERSRDQLVREAAELRKMLGQVLDYVGYLDALGASPMSTAVAPDGSAVLAPADLLQVLGGLDHAEALLRERAAAWCDDCASSPAEACQRHLDDLDQADAYRAVAARLGDAR